MFKKSPQALLVKACSKRSLDGILVDHAVLHDNDEVLVRVGDQVDVLERIAVDQKQVGIGTLPNHTVADRDRDRAARNA